MNFILLFLFFNSLQLSGQILNFFFQWFTIIRLNILIILVKSSVANLFFNYVFSQIETMFLGMVPPKLEKIFPRIRWGAKLLRLQKETLKKFLIDANISI